MKTMIIIFNFKSITLPALLPSFPELWTRVAFPKFFFFMNEPLKALFISYGNPACEGGGGEAVANARRVLQYCPLPEKNSHDILTYIFLSHLKIIMFFFLFQSLFFHIYCRMCVKFSIRNQHIKLLNAVSLAVIYAGNFIIFSYA